LYCDNSDKEDEAKKRVKSSLFGGAIFFIQKQLGSILCPNYFSSSWLSSCTILLERKILRNRCRKFYPQNWTEFLLVTRRSF